MEMDLKQAKAEIQRLQTEREKLEQVSSFLWETQWHSNKCIQGGRKVGMNLSSCHYETRRPLQNGV